MLAELLESIGRQSCQPVEVVVVDDGSTDNASEVAGSFERQHAGESDRSCVYDLTARGVTLRPYRLK